MITWALLLAGCAGGVLRPSKQPDDVVLPTVDTETTVSTIDTVPTVPIDTSTTDTAPVTSADTADTADTGTAVCPLPPLPVSWTYLPDLPAAEEFAFDAAGNLVVIDDAMDALVLQPLGAAFSLVAPYSSPETAGVAFMLDGRLVLADEGNGAVVILGMDGSKTVLNGSVYQPNSVTIDQAGQVYTTAFDQILRLDPVTGASTVVATIPGADLDGLVFSLDYLTLYFNYDEDSVVGQVELDAFGNTVDVSVVGNLPNPADYELNGQALDSCGNLYVISTDGSVYRIRTDGTMEEVIVLSGVPGMSTSALHFGSGLGGWERDHLYVMNRYGGVFDIDMDIEGRKDLHIP